MDQRHPERPGGHAYRCGRLLGQERNLAQAVRRASALVAAALALWPSLGRAADGDPPAVKATTPDGISIEACAGGRCQSRQVALPAELRASPNVSQTALTLASGRKIALIQAHGPGPGFYALLLARAADGGIDELLRGWVDRPQGAEGERSEKVLRIGGENLHADVVVGTRYENLTACGRTVLMKAQHLDPATLEWQPVPNIALTPADRDGAALLKAERSQDPYHPELPRLLWAQVATSAVHGAAAGLTDGRLDTSWSPAARDGAPLGEGELVVMSASADVPIEGFQLVMRGTAVGQDARAAPSALFLATDRQVMRVLLPEDSAAEVAGTVYQLKLPHPLRTDCVALVLDSMHPGSAEPAAIAEIRAVTPFDQDGAPAKLVALLDDAGGRAGAAEALLSRGGGAAVAAAIAGFSALGAGGKERAIEVIDGGDCAETAPFFASLLTSAAGRRVSDPDDPLADRARARLRGCGAHAQVALTALVGGGQPDRVRGLAARELAAIGPANAVPLIADALGGASSTLRAELRGALSVAAADARAMPALEALFAAPAWSAREPIARIDLLRALGPRLGAITGAAQALHEAARAGDFRSRYLLQQPAAELGRSGDRAALAYVGSSMLRDASPFVRAQAAAVGAVAALSSELTRALDDGSPRVREAALTSLAGIAPAPGSEARIASLLAADPWTFVRVAAATALGTWPSSAQSDEPLSRALDDSAPAVQRAAILALSRGKRARAAERVQEVAEDPERPPEVRASAIGALGRMCRFEAVSLLYKLALRAGAPELGYDRPLGLAALAALRDLHPADIADKLAPLAHDKRVPPQIRAIAREIIGSSGRCKR